MESLLLQQRVNENLGPSLSVEATSTGAGAVYRFYVLQTPLTSAGATQADAWQRVQDTLSFAITHASLFEPDCNVEVIVGFAEAVMATKRRIFRVGGPLAEIGTLRTAALVTKHGDVYVAAYDNWHSSDDRQHRRGSREHRGQPTGAASQD